MAIIKEAAVNICVQVSVWTYPFFSLCGKYLWADWLENMVNVCLTFKKLPNSFLEWLYHFTFTPTVYESCSRFTSLPALGMISLLNFSHSDRCGMVPRWILICILPKTNDVEHLYMCLFANCVSYFVKCLFKSFAQFLTALFVFLLLSFGFEDPNDLQLIFSSL